MEYRIARSEDLPDIAEYIASKEHFLPCDPGQLGGTWLVAEDNTGIRGTVWFFMQEPHMYVDYWAADTPRTAARLGVVLEAGIKKHIPSVRYIHGLILTSNTASVRLAIGLGMNAQDGYTLVYKELEWVKPQKQPLPV